MESIRIDLIEEEYIEVVFDLLSKLKIHSNESFVHSLDVAEKTLKLSSVFDIKNGELKRLYTASLLHDIGKLCIDESILHKRDATDAEREFIRFGHIEGTKNILSEFFDVELVRLASHHHERLNNSGYPEHLSAKNLSKLDRILQVADVASALEMSRSYKEAYNREKVIVILDNLVSRGELDKKCVKEIEKILFDSNDKPQFGK